jgi:hypothetical protein
MPDVNCQTIREWVEQGSMTPADGLALLLDSCMDDTPENRPDPKDADFWLCLWVCAAPLVKDVSAFVYALKALLV